jgi:hypothetical protein
MIPLFAPCIMKKHYVANFVQQEKGYSLFVVPGLQKLALFINVDGIRPSENGNVFIQIQKMYVIIQKSEPHWQAIGISQHSGNNPFDDFIFIHFSFLVARC